MLPVLQPLSDPQARAITYLRISLTDRCNYRCTYCLPAGDMQWLPRAEILRFEEIERIARCFAEIGVRRVRLTGGEPTLRHELPELVARLRGVPGIESVVMTTNGHRLGGMAEALAAAGLAEVNVSVDTLDREAFAALTRRGDLERVIAGIDAARAAGIRVKLNAVALRGVTESQVGALCRFGWERGAPVRFIEHMPMSSGEIYRADLAAGRPLSAADVRALASEQLGVELIPEAGDARRSSGPARYWLADGDRKRRIGIISAMTEHFCDTCNRVRLTAVGDLHTCLAFDDAVSLREIVRAGGTDEQLRAAIRAAVAGKRPGHEFQQTGGGAPTKHMISIGG